MSREFIYQRVRDKRIEAGVNRTELARRANRSIYAIVKVEQGQNRPSLELLAAYADALNCSIDEFFDVVSNGAA